MTIEFHCPHCDKLLKTSDEKAGLEAKCPGCGDFINVPNVAAGFIEQPVVDAEEVVSLESEGFEPDDDVSDATQPCPACGETIKAAAARCRFCGEILDKEKLTRGRRGGRREMRPFPPGEVIEDSWQIFVNNLGLLIGSYLLALFLVGLSLILPIGGFVLAAVLADQHNDAGVITGIVVGAVFTALVIVVSAYLHAGLVVLQIKLIRDETAQIHDLFTGWRFTGRLLACWLVVTVLVLIGFAACIVPGLLIMVVFLPAAYVLVDEDLPGLQSLWRAKQLTDGNWGSLFLILLASMGISMVASWACSIFGSLLTTPLTSLMFAVAYDRMTCQTPLSEIKRLADEAEEVT